jgi:hypothetical protein
MRSVEVVRERSDKLARQVYTFALDPVSFELVLGSYEYQERLTIRKRWVSIQQWRRDAVKFFTGGIDLEKIPLDPAIIAAAKNIFTKNLRVVKEPTPQDQ